MKIVLLFFCVTLALIIFLLTLIMSLTIKLNIANTKINNIENGIKKAKLDKEFLGYIELYLFGLIKIAKIKLKPSMFKKINIEKDVKKGIKVAKKLNIMEIIKKLKIKIERLKFDFEIGTEEVMFTVFAVTIISTILGIITKNINHKNVKYTIMPLYQFGNVIKINLNCIISVKVVHIIYVSYILFKKGMIKNERTSNRRSYDYSYE